MIESNHILSYFKGQGLFHKVFGYGVIHQIPQKPEYFMDGVERKVKMVPDLNNLLVGFQDGEEVYVTARHCEPASMPYEELTFLRTKHGTIELPEGENE